MRPTVNDLIFVAYDRIATDFLCHVVKHRARRFKTTEYSIFTNYIDSHLWFDDAELQRWYEVWRWF